MCLDSSQVLFHSPETCGYPPEPESPTPIQSKVLDFRSGRSSEVLASSQSGAQKIAVGDSLSVEYSVQLLGSWVNYSVGASSGRY